VSYRIKAKDEKASICVTPSDHIVTDTQEFQRVIKSSLQFAAESDAIVTLGMKPTRPETGYGYIQADLSAQSMSNKEIFRVESFREKPNLEKAQEYIKHNNYFWNAGIFVWKVSTVINAFRMFQPNIARIFEQMFDDGILGTPKEADVIAQRYIECENISVDYAIMEKADEIFVCPADFGWSDLGTWGSLHTLVKKDANKNGIVSKDTSVRTFNTENCIINVDGLKEVVVQGLDGYIVAERDGRLLICKLSEEQHIKEYQ
jgi:mannose-1-phosphate guanylyltransferase